MLTFSYSSGQLQKGLFGPAMLHGLAGAHKLATQSGMHGCHCCFCRAAVGSMIAKSGKTRPALSKTQLLLALLSSIHAQGLLCSTSTAVVSIVPNQCCGMRARDCYTYSIQL